MLKSFISLLIFITISSSVSGYEFIKSSYAKLITAENLKGKSREFARYARNEIFARRGYVFNDANLSLYFSKQPWYRPIGKNVSLSEIETQNVKILKQYEDTASYSDAKIIVSKGWNGYPLYYLGQNWDQSNVNWDGEHFKYWDGYFHLLPKNLLWTLNCKSIPAEFIINHATYSVEVTDDSGELAPDKIEFTNINKDCELVREEEVIARLEGPSDDPEVYILGLYEGRFKVLFHEYGELNEINCSGEVELNIEMSIRHDIAGTMYRDETFIFNQNTLKVRTPEREIIHFLLGTETLNKVALFETKDAAANQKTANLKGYIEKGVEVELSKFYQKDGRAVYLTSAKLNGWVYYGDVNFTNFWLSAAD